VRPVRDDDSELEEAFVRALSLESRYQRMLSGGIKVTPEWIDSMTHIDYQHHMAFAVTTVVDGVEQFVGVGRYVVDSHKSTAEIALVLADAWQGRALGRRLLATLLEHAQTARVREAVGVVLATTWSQLGIHGKPSGLLNVSGYYDGLLAMLDHAVNEGFLRPPYRELVMAETDADTLVQRLASFSPVQAGISANATGNFL